MLMSEVFDGRLKEVYNYHDESYWNELATVGWVRETYNKQLSLPLFKEAVDYGLEYLAEKLQEHEGIELTDSLIITRAYVAVMIYGIKNYYDKNPQILLQNIKGNYN